MSSDRSIVRLTSAVAAVAATTIAFGPPIATYELGRQADVGAISAEAEFLSKELSQLIGSNPLLWRFEEDRHLDILNDPGNSEPNDSKLILDEDGRVITELIGAGGRLGGPAIEARQPIFDSGVQVGQIVVRHSLAELVQRALLVSLITLPLGIGVFIATRSLPLRVMNRAINHAEFLASHDPLTRLPNRGLFHKWLGEAFKESQSAGTAAALLLIDLDRFKQVNDTFGHGVGDKLLVQVSDRIKRLLTDDDILVRMGGDEFAVLVNRDVTEDVIAWLAASLIADVSEVMRIDGQDVSVGASVGISFLGDFDASSPDAVYQRADLALYRAKSMGRGAYSFFDENLNKHLLERRQLEKDLIRAIENDEFRLCYQPQVSRQAHELVGVEALIRWTHPSQGEIPPARFISLAEDTGLIIPLGKWIIQQACLDAAGWPSVKVAINVSPAQFRQSDLVSVVREALDCSGLPAENLELEITEGILLEDTDIVIQTLNDLRNMGVGVAMDDFGTGYSSLSHLSRFPFSKIKIDRSFTRSIGVDEKVTSIVDAIIMLGKILGIRLNAEGVETEAQAAALDAFGCDELQGFLFSPAVEKSAIDAMVNNPDPSRRTSGLELLQADAEWQEGWEIRRRAQ